jgi:hypothetical protein
VSASVDRSGRVEYPAASHLVATGKRGKSAGESLDQRSSTSQRAKAKRAYVTRSRVESLGSQLHGQQRAVLADVGRIGVVTGRQLQRLHYGESAAGGRLARKHLGQLVRWQVLTRLDRTIGGERAGSAGFVYALGTAGQRLLQPGRRRFRPVWTPRQSYLRHALAVSELYVCLRELERSTSMELLAYDSEPKSWRNYFGPGGARSILKPDSLAVIGIDDYEDRYFIEADCSTEHRPHIIAKAKTYVRYWQSGREQAETGVFPYVLWMAPDEKRAGFLVDVLASMPPDHWKIFMVTTASSAPHRMATGTGVPITTYREEVT